MRAGCSTRCDCTAEEIQRIITSSSNASLNTKHSVPAQLRRQAKDLLAHGAIRSLLGFVRALVPDRPHHLSAGQSCQELEAQATAKLAPSEARRARPFQNLVSTSRTHPRPPPSSSCRSLVKRLTLVQKRGSATPNDTSTATGLKPGTKDVETNMSASRVEQVRVQKLFPGDGRSLLAAVASLDNGACSQAPMTSRRAERLHREHANRCSCRFSPHAVP